ncbi:glycosyl hydrolase family 32 [Christiangramia fulva]|uniref:Glycosyl hydrolase family 32 n=1 Tax=Christiangramia fulva TaxID=2126553 RepID=A0A2R3Z5G9_9FLAO|nr:glycoside hydrolase family 32 protein [Christiangramia fulva]AVR45521.1 glycosyl hydrolase family 32 [Christiangramia fulva]
MKRILFFGFFIILVFGACNNARKTEEKVEKRLDESIVDEEKFRPAFHFTPQAHWMNDPNGMFFLNGTYHLYFQYYPEDNVWGPMHWGHATSKDMIEWQQREIALKPDEKGYIFSGSAVYDKNNTSGLGRENDPPVVAMFTYHDPKGEKEGKINYQSQAIAFSLDSGYTWTKYKNNPVIKNPGLKDFRDPKMTWDPIHKKWLMVLSANDRSIFYSSENLKDWQKLSEFGMQTGAHDGVWECPDFFPMKVEDSEEIKWVLIQSLNPGGYNGGSGTQYFIGDFDGKTFTPERNFKDLKDKHNYWLDFGRDNYAGVTWSNIPSKDGRTLFLGWMSNWLYAQEVPTEKWRSSMTLPRELTLKKTNSDYRIFSTPARELEKYKSAIQLQSKRDQNKVVFTAPAQSDLMSNEFNFAIPLKEIKKLQFSLSNSQNDSLKFGLNTEDHQFYVNRKKSGLIDFSDKFTQKFSTAPRIVKSDTLKVNFIVDRTSIEIFYDDGATVMTEIFFPEEPYTKFGIHADSKLEIENMEISRINTDGKEWEK